MNISDLLNPPSPARIASASSFPAAECTHQSLLDGAVARPQRLRKRPTKTPPIHATSNTVVPDNQRKRPYRISVTQQLNRRVNANYESKVFNLTLDNNALRQQVQHLMECRDLYLSRLFLNRQQLEGDVLDVAEKLVNGFSKKGPNLTASQRSCVLSSENMVDSQGAGGGVHQLVLERGTHIFSHRSWMKISSQVINFVEEEEDGASPDASEIRRLCGGSNGCVVEMVGMFTGRIKRDMIVAFYPHVLSDEALVARLIGYSITCPVRLVFYFDDQRRITHQLAQVDVVASMKLLQKERPEDHAALMGGSKSIS